MKVTVLRAWLGVLAVIAWSGCSAQAQGGLVAVPDGSLVRAPVRSLVELRFTNVVRQAYDLSCGAAALATILNHYYGDQVSERTIIDAMLEIGTRDKILKDGFSLLELKRFAEKEGYVSAGYRLDKVDDLVKVKVPSIALVNVRGYAHFVVIKGVVGGQVYVADPAFGNRARSLKSFAREWNQVILVVLSPTRPGNAAFIEDGTLRARPGEVILLLDRALHSISPRFGEVGFR